MTTATLSSRSAPVRCRCRQRPLPPCELIPTGSPGVVEINGSSYVVKYHVIDEEIVGVRLVKVGGGGVPYDIGPDGVCDCPSATFRPEGPCKHAIAAGQLIERGELIRFTDA